MAKKLLDNLPALNKNDFVGHLHKGNVKQLDQDVKKMVHSSIAQTKGKIKADFKKGKFGA